MKVHTTEMEPFAAIAERARKNVERREQATRIAELVREIDELSGKMGTAAFRDAVRLLGYDIDADLGMLFRRGVDRYEH